MIARSSISDTPSGQANGRKIGLDSPALTAAYQPMATPETRRTAS